MLAYSKSENGSAQFFRAMERFVLRHKDALAPQELANVVYSYAMTEHASEELLKNLRQAVRAKMHRMRPEELCSVMRAYSMRDLLGSRGRRVNREGLFPKNKKKTNLTEQAEHIAASEDELETKSVTNT